MKKMKKKQVNFYINKKQKNRFKHLCLKQKKSMISVANTLIKECVCKNEKEIKKFFNSDTFYYDLEQPVEVINDSVVLSVSMEEEMYYNFKVFCHLRNKTQSYMLSLLIDNYLKEKAKK